MGARESNTPWEVGLKQSNHNHKYNYNLMGFDTIEINLVLG